MTNPLHLPAYYDPMMVRLEQAGLLDFFKSAVDHVHHQIRVGKGDEGLGLGKLPKSKPSFSSKAATKVASKHGWNKSGGSSTHTEFNHPTHTGHTLTMTHPEGDWEHFDDSGKYVAHGTGTASLHAHLRKHNLKNPAAAPPAESTAPPAESTAPPPPTPAPAQPAPPKLPKPPKQPKPAPPPPSPQSTAPKPPKPPKPAAPTPPPPPITPKPPVAKPAKLAPPPKQPKPATPPKLKAAKPVDQGMIDNDTSNAEQRTAKSDMSVSGKILGRNITTSIGAGQTYHVKKDGDLTQLVMPGLFGKFHVDPEHVHKL